MFQTIPKFVDDWVYDIVPELPVDDVDEIAKISGFDSMELAGTPQTQSGFLNACQTENIREPR